MVNQRTTRNIDQLATNLMNLLESKGYSPGTKNNYHRLLSRISVFMKRKKIIEYTEEIGEAFFAEHIASNNVTESNTGGKPKQG